ncbi:hypothetical protein DFH28DRAFT_483121, partial [Melampsora americana]
MAALIFPFCSLLLAYLTTVLLTILLTFFRLLSLNNSLIYYPLILTILYPLKIILFIRCSCKFQVTHTSQCMYVLASHLFLPFHSAHFRLYVIKES